MYYDAEHVLVSGEFYLAEKKMKWFLRDDGTLSMGLNGSQWNRETNSYNAFKLHEIKFSQKSYPL